MKATKNKRVELSKTHIDRWCTTITEEKSSEFYFHFFLLQSSQLFFHSPDPRSDGQWRSRIQVYFNSRPLGDALTRELAQEWGGATSLDFVHFVCKSKKECSIRWMKFILTWFACLKRKEVKLRFLTLEEKLLCEENFSLHYSWQAS